jgi:hypothetical protein
VSEWTTREEDGWAVREEPGPEDESSLQVGDDLEAADDDGAAAPDADELAAELVELAVPDAPEERLPLIGGEPEDRAPAVPAVPDADRASGLVRYLHAVAVRPAQAGLDPLWHFDSPAVVTETCNDPYCALLLDFSQEEAVTARSPDVSAEAAELASLLLAAGLADVAERVSEAAEAARTDPVHAEALLREASDAVMARVPAYSYRRKTP